MNFILGKSENENTFACIQPTLEGTAKCFTASYEAIIWNMIFKSRLLTTPLISKITLRRR